ncbi:Permease of the drug/metabolite transporter (DMT) superfamily [Thalassobaculum litoreum DSM 18839]|uniref:Permease of the drug/metabolite transporter (DMT) superfamily n=1 Tax=Thalassobaculum litoreum DSM 18839 TaxID=1123362 RepID=A0A8G2BMF9_9PROT|nr:Permease of the drug/metabolite transporter (DMT) superfamily [Thalassobaculum litoreum DSM 18839]
MPPPSDSPQSADSGTPALATPLVRFRSWWDGLSGNVRGSIWLFAAGLVFAVMGALIKFVGQRLPVVEILFLRQAFVIVVVSPAIIKGFPAVFRTERLGLHTLRVGLSAIAMTTGFTALVHLPLAEATAISFSRTLFTTMLAVVILHEIVGWRRWTATAVGFVGVVIVAHPSPSGLNEYALLALLSAFFVAMIMICLRMLARTERPATIIAYQSVCLTVILAGPAWYFWVWPTWEDLALTAVIGGVMSLAQFVNIKAYSNGEAAAIAPVEYIRLLASAGLGFMMFSEVPTIYTVIGAVFIIGSTLYTIRRNAMKNTPVPPRPPEVAP